MENEILLGLSYLGLELSLPREGALLSFEQLRPMTPGALHNPPPIHKPRDAIYYHNNVGFGFCLPGDGICPE